MSQTSRFAFALSATLLAAAGCNDDNNRLQLLETHAQVDNAAGLTLSARIDTEVASRQLGDAETLAAAKAYTDGQFSKGETAVRLDLEVERAKAAEADALAQSKAYTDATVAKLPVVKVAHLFAEVKGGPPVDLGRHHGQAFGAAQFGGKPVDLWRDGVSTWIYFDDINGCTGNAFLLAPPRLLGRDRFIGGGKVYAPTSTTTVNASPAWRMNGMGVCEKKSFNADFVPLTATGDSATAYDPLSLYVDDVVEGG